LAKKIIGDLAECNMLLISGISWLSFGKFWDSFARQSKEAFCQGRIAGLVRILVKPDILTLLEVCDKIYI